MDLTLDIGAPPTPRARWCPRCRTWLDASEQRGRRRCVRCGTAVIRPMRRPAKPKPGELRPGVIAEFNDPRDRYDPTAVVAEARRRLAVLRAGT